MINKTYLLLGGNQGQRQNIIKKAIDEINKKVGEVSKISKMYESEPWGFISENTFLNCVVEVKSALSPAEILTRTQEIEKKLGRKKKTNKLQYCSRNIDIDILFFGNEIIAEENLTIPHPRLHERRFTLLPLADVCPNLKHPILKKKCSELLKECKDTVKTWLLE